MAIFTTPDCVVSFPNVIKGKTTDSGGKQFDITVLFDKSNPDHVAFLKEYRAACEKVLEEMPDSRRPAYPMVGHNKSPIKDADKNENGKGELYATKYPERAGHFFISAATYGDKPNTVQRNSDGSLSAVMDPNKFYSGCICKVNLNPYERKRDDNPGVSNGLNGVMFISDGERIGGGRPSEEDMWGQTASDSTSASSGSGGGEDPFDL